jgi:CRISPR-associated protein Cmr3
MDERGVLFEPIDVLQFRDGRPFDAGADALARSMAMPTPSTIAGAVVSAFGSKVRRIRGPVAATWSSPEDVTGYVPAPNDLVLDPRGGNQTFTRLSWDRVATTPSVRGNDVCRGPEGTGDPAVGRMISVGALTEYLAGSATKAIRELAPGAKAPFQVRHELRTGVAIGDSTDRTGFLYSGQFVRTHPGPGSHTHAGYAALLRSDSAVARRTVRLGGEAGQVEVTACLPHALKLPPVPTVAPNAFLLVYLATPAIFAGGWRPPLRPEIELIGACLTGPDAIASGSSGRWSVGAAVPAGAVYLLRFMSEDWALEFAARAHGRCLAQAHDDLARKGFGLCFTGGL